MIFIGIDPGDNTGLAVWDGESFRQLATLPLHKALEEVKRWKYAALMSPVYCQLCVIFEDARQRQWLPKEKSVSEYRGRLMGAGAAKRDAKIWEEFLQDEKITYFAQAPRSGQTKWSADYFARITGYAGRTSNHARDAALLVFGRK